MEKIRFQLADGTVEETIEMKGRPKLVLKASSQLKDQEANAS